MKKYKKPTVLKQVTVMLEAGLLQGSVVNNETKIETAGQTVEEHSFDPQNTSFNTTWE